MACKVCYVRSEFDVVRNNIVLVFMVMRCYYFLECIVCGWLIVRLRVGLEGLYFGVVIRITLCRFW